MAVDTLNGVLKYDYGAANYTRPGGSSGQSKAGLKALFTRGKVQIEYRPSIYAAAGTDTYYEFDETPAEDGAMANRMFNSASHPLPYSLIVHNCGNASFEIAQHGWPNLAPNKTLMFGPITYLSTTPKAFLDIVQQRWQMQNVRTSIISSITFVNNIPDMTIADDF